MSTQIQTTSEADVMESVVIGGDLKSLSPAERVQYYKAVCDSLGINPLTRPFEYMTLNGKLTLYARKDATDQLREKRGISIIGKPDITFEGDWIIVSVMVSSKDGRTDADIGVVNKKDMQGNFGNALMKAITKAKRRATLSICGLGMLDETEIETIPDARPVHIEEVETVPALTLEEAMEFTATDGRKFGNMDFEELREMLAKGLAIKHPTKEQALKIEALNLLLSEAETA